MKKQILLMMCLFVACADLPERPHFLEPAPPGAEGDKNSEDAPSVTDEKTGQGDESSEPTQEGGMVETPPPEVPHPEEAVPQVADVPPDVAPAGGDVTSPPPTTVEEVTPIVINELYYDAVGSDTNGSLFVELYSKEGQFAQGKDLSGYQLVFVNGDDGKVYNTLTLPPGAKVGKGGFYVIADAKTGLEGETFVPGADWIVNFDPQNGPDAVQLLNSEAEFMDVLGYGALSFATANNTYPLFEGNTAPDVVNGHSLARKTPGLDTDNNLIDFIDQEVPTPGF